MRSIELNPVRGAMVNDPAHCRWASYRANGLGLAEAHLAAHPTYLGLGDSATKRQAAYRRLFRHELDAPALSDMRMALNQTQPLGNKRFYDKIERITGELCEAKQRGRARLEEKTNNTIEQQGILKW